MSDYNRNSIMALYNYGMQPESKRGVFDGIPVDNRTEAKTYADEIKRLLSAGIGGDQDYLSARLGLSVPIGRFNASGGATYGGPTADILERLSGGSPQMVGRDIGASYSSGGLNVGVSANQDEASKERAYRLFFNRKF